MSSTRGFFFLVSKGVFFHLSVTLKNIHCISVASKWYSYKDGLIRKSAGLCRANRDRLDEFKFKVERMKLSHWFYLFSLSKFRLLYGVRPMESGNHSKNQILDS